MTNVQLPRALFDMTSQSCVYPTGHEICLCMYQLAARYLIAVPEFRCKFGNAVVQGRL